MARYTPDSKEKVRDAVDFLDLVGQYSDLRKAGPASYKGLCPFHEERTPSFNINADEKFFKCFGCGEGGDVFSFVQKMEGLDFVAALESLAERYGVPLELQDEDPAAAARRQQQTRLTELLKRTTDFYVRNLWESPEAANARAYLAERGLDEALLREFRVGYAPRRWDAVLIPSRRAGYSEQELLDAGLVIRSQKGGAPYDRFRARITFPLCDRKGQVMGFGARRLADDDSGPKYLNSNDGPVFHKGKNVYASDIARVHATKAGAVILAEGFTDVIALHQAGLRNTVGLMGTALTTDQVTELARLAPVVLLALDADSAGQEAMLRAARVAAGRHLQLRVVPLPAGLDPADLVREQGAEAMRALVTASVPFVTFRVRRVLDCADMATAEGKDAAIDLLRPVFADIPPSALREELVRTVADRTDVAPTLLASWLAGPQRSAPAAAAAPVSVTAPSTTAPTPVPVAPLPDGADARTERALLVQVVARPDVGRAALREIGGADVFSAGVHRRAATHLLTHDGSPAAQLPDDDPDLASLMAGLLVRAGEQLADADTLRAEILKLRLAAVERQMKAAAASGSADMPALARERQGLQTAVREAIGRHMDAADG